MPGERASVILMKEKSFAKLFEPTTFIQEDEPSFEEETDGLEAKSLFFKKGLNIEKIVQR